MKLQKEQLRHYSLFAVVILISGAASIAYGSAQAQAGCRLAGFVLLFIGFATLLFTRFARMAGRKK